MALGSKISEVEHEMYEASGELSKLTLERPKRRGPRVLDTARASVGSEAVSGPQSGSKAL